MQDGMDVRLMASEFETTSVDMLTGKEYQNMDEVLMPILHDYIKS